MHVWSISWYAASLNFIIVIFTLTITLRNVLLYYYYYYCYCFVILIRHDHFTVAICFIICKALIKSHHLFIHHLEIQLACDPQNVRCRSRHDPEGSACDLNAAGREGPESDSGGLQTSETHLEKPRKNRGKPWGTSNCWKLCPWLSQRDDSWAMWLLKSCKTLL